MNINLETGGYVLFDTSTNEIIKLFGQYKSSGRTGGFVRKLTNSNDVRWLSAVYTTIADNINKTYPTAFATAKDVEDVIHYLNFWWLNDKLSPEEKLKQDTFNEKYEIFIAQFRDFKFSDQNIIVKRMITKHTLEISDETWK